MGKTFCDFIKHNVSRLHITEIDFPRVLEDFVEIAAVAEFVQVNLRGISREIDVRDATRFFVDFRDPVRAVDAVMLQPLVVVKWSTEPGFCNVHDSLANTAFFVVNKRVAVNKCHFPSLAFGVEGEDANGIGRNDFQIATSGFGQKGVAPI